MSNLYLPGLFKESYFSPLRDTTPWSQRSVRIFGRMIPQPRLISWYGSHSYTYSGVRVDPLPWTDLLLHVKEAVEKETGLKFNSVLLNLYRNGSDSVAWHSDDEPELGDNPAIASVSFGATRKFQVRSKTSSFEKYDLNLQDCSLFLMEPGMQRTWQHQVPKVRGPVGERINLTFRRVI